MVDDLHVTRQGHLVKPCPLCGGVRLSLYDSTDKSKARVEHTCPVVGFSDSREIIIRGVTLEHAIAIWNERPPR